MDYKKISYRQEIKKGLEMDRSQIIIRNAHTNNLKNIDIEIPKHKLVVLQGFLGQENRHYFLIPFILRLKGN